MHMCTQRADKGEHVTRLCYHTTRLLLCMPDMMQV